MRTTTFKARNNHVVTVAAPLWERAQALLAQRKRGRLTVDDAAALIMAVDAEGDLPLQRRSLKHIRRYFRWTEAGGKALVTLKGRAGQHHWSAEGIEAAIKELKGKS